MDNRSIKKLEADLWESADLLRAGSKLTIKPVLYAGARITLFKICV